MLSLLFKYIERFNTVFLRVGRQLAWLAIFLMVVVILIQVFFRYILNNALPWPDEVARFLMLWMTGLIAPSAYRWGGFVSIDVISKLLPTHVGNILALALLFLSLTILLIGFNLGLQHIKMGWIFESASIKLPWQLIGGKQEAMKLAWMYMSIPVGVFFLISVTIELILRNLISLLKPDLSMIMDTDKEKLES
ncbi:MAG: TRAP transporter small permease subunit [Pseudomonadota bacterium]|nr:TRAP transporter small permease subunit [Pseudomonadota bacterium]